MSIFKKEEILDKAFKNFKQSDSRIIFQMTELSQLLKNQPEAHSILLKHINLKIQHKPIQVFKWMILLNKIIMDFSIKPEQMLQILQNIKTTQKDEFDSMLLTRLINPYKLYLMKRCQFLPKKSNLRDKMYQLINLIHTGICFSDIIYTLGRYYIKKYPFTIDFNIVLGSDLGSVYDQMVRNVPKPVTFEILEQIQVIHEKMYVVYYNCYFYKYLKPFVPKWVVTDIGSKQKNKSTLIMSNKSLVSTAGSSNLKKSTFTELKTQEFDLSKSTIFQNSTASIQQKMNQSFLLLKSMERVFQMVQMD